MIPATITREMTIHSAEHEIFMSFNEDVHAEYFSYWWNDEGFKSFEKWYERTMDEEIDFLVENE